MGPRGMAPKRVFFMPYITAIQSDVELSNVLGSFLSAAADNADALGMSPEAIEELGIKITDFKARMASVNAQRAAYHASVTAKDESAADLRKELGRLSKTWRAKDTIDDSLLAELRVAPHETPPTFTAVTTPRALVFRADAQGNIRLKWDRNGNTRGTIFQIEASYDRTRTWQIVRTTTASKATLHSNVGEQVLYRVAAVRGGVTSVASSPIVVWPSAAPAESAHAA